MDTKKIINGAKSAGLVTAGAVGHRLLTKVADKVVQKAAPALSAKPLYRYGKEVAFIALGLIAPTLLKGEQRDMAEKIGLGIAADSAASLVSTISNGRLAGDEDLLGSSFQSIDYAPSVSSYLPPALHSLEDEGYVDYVDVDSDSDAYKI